MTSLSESQQRLEGEFDGEVRHSEVWKRQKEQKRKRTLKEA
jgi:hypothetical protein